MSQLQEEILTPREAARLGRLKPNTFRKWRQLGIGPDYIRVSQRCVRYRREDVLRWMEQRRVQPEAAHAPERGNFSRENPQ
jgi:predicted DNA-binding transcriptional regulator AlpA